MAESLHRSWQAPTRGGKIRKRGDQMLSYGGKDLASGCRPVRTNDIQVAEDIPESKYGFVAAPEVHSVARMLAHIDISTRTWEEIHRTKRMTTQVGFDFLGMRARLNAEEAKTRSKTEILELLRTEGEQFAAWLETLTPGVLAGLVNQPIVKNQKQQPHT